MTALESFPTKQELSDLAQIMTKKYEIYLEGRQFDLDAWNEGKDQAINARVLLRNHDDSFFYPVEARVAYLEEELLPVQAAFFLLDYIDTYFEEYLTSAESTFIPIDWTDFEYEGVSFQMKGQVLNHKLEAMADQWLRGASSLPQCDHHH